MNKRAWEKLQQAIERAVHAFEALEKAIDSGNHREIGARLSELRRALQEVNVIASK